MHPSNSKTNEKLLHIQKIIQIRYAIIKTMNNVVSKQIYILGLLYFNAS